MTPQEIFDKAVDGMLKQGGPSISGVGQCAYRGMDGKKCAVGHLISDEMYRSDMDSDAEDTGIEDVLERHPDLPKWFFDNKELLKDLQKAHDGPMSWNGNGDATGHMKTRLKTVARDFKLNFDPSKYTWAA